MESPPYLCVCTYCHHCLPHLGTLGHMHMYSGAVHILLVFHKLHTWGQDTMHSSKNSYTGRRKSSYIFVLQSVTDAPQWQKSSHKFTLWLLPHHPTHLLLVPLVLVPVMQLLTLLYPQSLWLPATSLSLQVPLLRFCLAWTGTLGQVFYVLYSNS